MPKSGIAPQLVNHLKQCAIALVKPENRANGLDQASPTDRAIAETARAKDRQERSHHQRTKADPLKGASPLRGQSTLPHLRALPSHAHHIRYAQSKGLSLKVSDEFTVPLCAIHHHQIHTTGKERSGGKSAISIPLSLPVAFGNKAANAMRQRLEPATLRLDSTAQKQASQTTNWVDQ